MIDGGKVNDDGFTSSLDRLAQGFSSDELYKANSKTAEVFKNTVTDLIPKRSDVEEKYHIRDSVKIERKKNNAATVGILKKSKKAYVARFINDGWDSSWNGKRNGHKVQGLHFWEKAAKQAEEPMNTVMKEEVKKIINKKAGGN
ncbi:hypothetical protein PDA01_06560 [Pediococcus damnosus]|uniref:HK97 gp10 family phage protein n=1 Tax=Pediococcus damnosus TaxID=51663 RepID=UPI001144D230|nr:HK97 gp10 family phage protein [Pediococcus damnosus]GEA92763.1 hypothetical protein PDA01_06560 [Pediococcus damnosus]